MMKSKNASNMSTNTSNNAWKMHQRIDNNASTMHEEVHQRIGQRRNRTSKHVSKIVENAANMWRNAPDNAWTNASVDWQQCMTHAWNMHEMLEQWWSNASTHASTSVTPAPTNVKECINKCIRGMTAVHDKRRKMHELIDLHNKK